MHRIRARPAQENPFAPVTAEAGQLATGGALARYLSLKPKAIAILKWMEGIPSAEAQWRQHARLENQSQKMLSLRTSLECPR